MVLILDFLLFQSPRGFVPILLCSNCSSRDRHLHQQELSDKQFRELLGSFEVHSHIGNYIVGFELFKCAALAVSVTVKLCIF